MKRYLVTIKADCRSYLSVGMHDKWTKWNLDSQIWQKFQSIFSQFSTEYNFLIIERNNLSQRNFIRSNWTLTLFYRERTQVSSSLKKSEKMIWHNDERVVDVVDVSRYNGRKSLNTEISSSPVWCGRTIDVEETPNIVVDLHIVTDVRRRECKYAIERERERGRGREREWERVFVLFWRVWRVWERQIKSERVWERKWDKILCVSVWVRERESATKHLIVEQQCLMS